MFVKRIHMIWKLTVENAAPEKKKWFFQSATPQRTVLYFKTKHEAEQYHYENCRFAERTIEQVRAIENQGKWWAIQDHHFKRKFNLEFSPEIKNELNKIRPCDLLIGVKEVKPKYRSDDHYLDPVDFSADATYFIHAVQSNHCRHAPKRHPIVKLDPVPIVLTENIDATLAAQAQEPPAPSAPSMHELGMKNN